MTHSRDRADELSWIAFRYVAGEMSAAEQWAFETRLARDPAACAAVAEAVELTGAVRRAAPALPRTARPSRRSRPAIKLAASIAAACLAVVIGLRVTTLPTEHETDRAAFPLSWPDLREPASLPELLNWQEEDDETAMAASDNDSGELRSWMVELAGLGEDASEEPEAAPED
jgi:anti-sigma factor RsiW